MTGEREGFLADLVVVIPTLDEEVHIERAIRSAVGLAHVVVVDSGSTDRTQHLASALGAEVVEHPWQGYAAQKNWALDTLVDRFEWVLFLDADEWVSGDLASEIRARIRSGVDGFHLPRRNIFEGRLLRHAWWYPDYQLRLFRTAKGRFEDRLVHEHVIVQGPVGFLSSPLMHENLKGLEAFVERHVRYADLEAREMRQARSGLAQGQRQGRLLGSWPERRRFMKSRIWYQLPFRPAFRFVWMFVIKRGFLDGKQGLVYCQLLAAYEAMIDARLLELERADAVVAHGKDSVASQPLPMLHCPTCRKELASTDAGYDCASCGRSYPLSDGIPVLLADVELAEHDELDHGFGHDRDARAHKVAQAAHYDQGVAEEYEITRPHGTPAFYQWLLRQKFLRATRPLAPDLQGISALTVCGGSGLDAEFLARKGARVVATDISLGAARRTRERARRFGLDIQSVVADVEHLPFADRSFDLVLVHDGLHHLAHPNTGLKEMARVAGRWVSITEPARALATRVAVKAGLALDREEAGNRVGRLLPEEVAVELRNAGFRTLTVARYAMYYRHEPGSVARVASRKGVSLLARSIWHLGNAVVGRAGNKMVVVAQREDT